MLQLCVKGNNKLTKWFVVSHRFNSSCSPVKFDFHLMSLSFLIRKLLSLFLRSYGKMCIFQTRYVGKFCSIFNSAVSFSFSLFLRMKSAEIGIFCLSKTETFWVCESGVLNTFSAFFSPIKTELPQLFISGSKVLSCYVFKWFNIFFFHFAYYPDGCLSSSPSGYIS